MVLHSPTAITARLLPGVKIGDAWISIEPTGREKAGRIVWTMYIDFADGTEFSCNDLSTFRHDTQNALASCLSFLSACGEGYGYQLRTGRESDNADMFPANVAEWAYQNSDELSMLSMELEETEGLIED